MDFFTFLLVNAVLFLRPAEIVPGMVHPQTYLIVMLACLAFSFMRLLHLFFGSPLLRHPTVICAFAMLVLAGISLAVNNDAGKAFEEELEFVKVIVYFCLFLAVVNTPARLQGVIAVVALCLTVTAALAILHYYEYINITALTQQVEVLDTQVDGEDVMIRRLRFTGILHDANEVGVFVSVLTFLCGYQLTSKKHGLARLIWAVPIGLFLFAIFLTKSRGGLLAFLAGLTLFSLYAFRPKMSYFGPKRKSSMMGVVFLGLAVPLVLIAFGGRQTEISTNATTAQHRFGLWSDWLQEFRENPLIGVGPKIMSTDINPETMAFVGDRKLLAHNSYLQPFADLGFFGGMSFLGAVGFAFITLNRFSYDKTIILDPDLARLQPYLMAALGAYAVGFFTLTINYILPTFFVLALPVAYYGVTPSYPRVERPSLSLEALIKIGIASVGFLAFTYGMIMVMPKQ
jgi:putative inorganic carbon (HCO3(-)) transporter